MKGLSRFIPDLERESTYALEIDTFFIIEEVYRQKVMQLMEFLWYRGALLITKKFKFLKRKLETGTTTNGR